MTYELRTADFRAVARVVNAAYRFTCSCLSVDARSGPDGVAATFTFAGSPLAMTRLRSHIDRIADTERSCS